MVPDAWWVGYPITMGTAPQWPDPPDAEVTSERITPYSPSPKETMPVSDTTRRGPGREAVASASRGPGSVLCWPGLTFDRVRVIAEGAPAQVWSPAGDLWEYQAGAFFVTGRGERARRRVDDATAAPEQGWTHAPDCYCPACRVAVP